MSAYNENLNRYLNRKHRIAYSFGYIISLPYTSSTDGIKRKLEPDVSL